MFFFLRNNLHVTFISRRLVVQRSERILFLKKEEMYLLKISLADFAVLHNLRIISIHYLKKSLYKHFLMCDTVTLPVFIISSINLLFVRHISAKEEENNPCVHVSKKKKHFYLIVTIIKKHIFFSIFIKFSDDVELKHKKKLVA